MYPPPDTSFNHGNKPRTPLAQSQQIPQIPQYEVTPNTQNSSVSAPSTKKSQSWLNNIKTRFKTGFKSTRSQRQNETPIANLSRRKSISSLFSTFRFRDYQNGGPQDKRSRMISPFKKSRGTDGSTRSKKIVKRRKSLGDVLNEFAPKASLRNSDLVELADLRHEISRLNLGAMMQWDTGKCSEYDGIRPHDLYCAIMSIALEKNEDGLASATLAKVHGGAVEMEVRAFKHDTHDRLKVLEEENQSLCWSTAPPPTGIFAAAAASIHGSDFSRSSKLDIAFYSDYINNIDFGLPLRRDKETSMYRGLNPEKRDFLDRRVEDSEKAKPSSDEATFQIEKDLTNSSSQDDWLAKDLASDLSTMVGILAEGNGELRPAYSASPSLSSSAKLSEDEFGLDFEPDPEMVQEYWRNYSDAGDSSNQHHRTEKIVRPNSIPRSLDLSDTDNADSVGLAKKWTDLTRSARKSYGNATININTSSGCKNSSDQKNQDDASLVSATANFLHQVVVPDKAREDEATLVNEVAEYLQELAATSSDNGNAQENKIATLSQQFDPPLGELASSQSIIQEPKTPKTFQEYENIGFSWIEHQQPVHNGSLKLCLQPSVPAVSSRDEELHFLPLGPANSQNYRQHTGGELVFVPECKLGVGPLEILPLPNSSTDVETYRYSKSNTNFIDMCSRTKASDPKIGKKWYQNSFSPLELLMASENQLYEDDQSENTLDYGQCSDFGTEALEPWNLKTAQYSKVSRETSLSERKEGSKMEILERPRSKSKVGALINVFQAHGLMPQNLKPGVLRTPTPLTFTHQTNYPTSPGWTVNGSDTEGGKYLMRCESPLCSRQKSSLINRVPTPFSSFSRPESSNSNIDTDESEFFGEQLERFRDP